MGPAIMATDYTLRRRAMQRAAQLPDNPEHAKRIIEHMRRLIEFADTPPPDAEKPLPRLAHVE